MEEIKSFTCKTCNKEETENVDERLECSACKSIFHKKCVLINDNMLSWNCSFCNNLSAPTAPKSRRSVRSVVSRHSSTHSQKLALQMLEEQKALMQRSVDEKLQIEKQLLQKSIDKKLHIDQQFLKKKFEILHEGSRTSGSQISSTEKVNKWIEQNRDTVPEAVPDAEAGNVNPDTIITIADGTTLGEASSGAKLGASSQEKVVNLGAASQERVANIVKTLTSTAIDPEGLEHKESGNSAGNNTASPTTTSQGENQLKFGQNLNDVNPVFAPPQGPPFVPINKIRDSTVPVAIQPAVTGYQTFAAPVTQKSSFSSATNNCANKNGITVNHEPQTNETSMRPHDISRSATAARKVVCSDLPLFDGRAKDWPEFIGAYEFTTEICELTEFENAARLQKFLKGIALEAVKNTLYTPNGASNGIQTLRRLFGQPEFIINDLLNDLRSSVKPSPGDVDSIIKYSLKVGNLCATMKVASLQNHLKNPMLLQELVNYLTPNLLSDWAKVKHQNPSADIETFSLWLRTEADVLIGVLQTAPLQANPVKSSSVNFHTNALSTRKCIACQGICAFIGECNKFTQLKLSEKWDLVKNNNICRTCLKRHKGECKFKGNKCGVDNCVFGHHKLLHKYTNNASDPVHLHEGSRKNILFKIVPVKISKNGKEIMSYAILDDCSSLTLMEQSLADSLGIVGTNLPLHLKWTGDTTRSEMSSQVINVSISGCNSSKSFNMDQVRTVNNLNLPRQSQIAEEFKQFNHLKGIPLPSFLNAEPRMLIGLPHAKLLTTCKVKMGKSTEPIAAKTPLGWVVYGTAETDINPVFHMSETSSDSLLDEELKNYFSIESLGISQKHLDVESLEQSRAKQILINSTKPKENYFETGLLWKFDDVSFPSSYKNAMNRLFQLENRLKKEPELAATVNNLMKEYLEKGYTRILSQDEVEATKDNCWYLPVFVVRNPNKPGKVRLVWDAASKVQNVSLNSMLLKGPDTLTSLPGILRRFREKKIAFTGDIREMFHRVHINKDDQKFQLFLWRFDQSPTPSVLCMNVMTFGATCSPASANYVLNLNAERFVSDYPEAVHSIKRSHYVDDLLECSNTREEALKLAQDIKLIHSKGGFEIRNWICNDEYVSKILNDTPTENDFKLEIQCESNLEKVLGLWWETNSDNFMFSLKFNKSNEAILSGEQIPSKRDVLRTMMSIFDPLGFLSHILVHPRILLQNIWRTGISWDEPIPKVLFDQWKLWVLNLKTIENIRIPRFYGLEQHSIIELHTFVDASEDAFACSIYLRIVSGVSIKCVLVAAKSKVAPLKPMSMPRLELQAALIGARQASNVKQEQNFSVSREVFWSDSETVLSWLKTDARRYRQFVAVRIGEILELSKASDWRYVPTKMNVADLATRKVVLRADYESSWFQGPSFLYHPEANWPEDKKRSYSKEEMRPQFINGELHFHNVGVVNVEDKSNWLRVRRTQAYVLRYISNCKAKSRGLTRVSGPLTKLEYINAENILFKTCQQEGYPGEYACLLNKPPLPVEKDSAIYKDAPYIDSHGVLRSKSRLSASQLILDDVKVPILLPKHHRTTMLMLDYYHVKYHHINMETAVNEVRQKFIIPTLRVLMKSIQFKCQFCKNRRAKAVTPFMANIPDARLGAFSRPFSYVGIDYFGPMMVSVKRSTEKRWGVIITCLTVRAIHIEIAGNLTTDSCMMCLQRFICRRGLPLEIYSDNGKNLKGASKELALALQSVDETVLAEKFNNEVTQWIFIPPSAPHMGGAWERLVRSIKVGLSIILPTRTPKEELLSTMMAEVENMVNSRPLTYIPLDSDLDEALTPNHFLLGSSSGKKPFGAFSTNVWVLKNNWKRSEEFSDRLWKKWKLLYLPELRRRHTFNEHVPNVKVGDIAILCDDDQPRNQWPKVKVLAVYPSSDGIVRRVTIKSAKGVYVRPVSKLAILDVGNVDQSTTTDHVEVLGGLSTTEKPITHVNETLVGAPFDQTTNDLATPDEATPTEATSPNHRA